MFAACDACPCVRTGEPACIPLGALCARPSRCTLYQHASDSLRASPALKGIPTVQCHIVPRGASREGLGRTRRVPAPRTAHRVHTREAHLLPVGQDTDTGDLHGRGSVRIVPVGSEILGVRAAVSRQDAPKFLEPVTGIEEDAVHARTRRGRYAVHESPDVAS